MQLRKRKMIEVFCGDCDESRIVRSDFAKKSKNTLCKGCTSKRGGSAKKPSRITGQNSNCINCGETFWLYNHLKNKRKFCSHKCASENKSQYKKEYRECNNCKKTFYAKETPFSNSKGLYCSFGCRVEAQKTGVKVKYKSTLIAARARYAVSAALKNKRLIKPKSCEFCSEIKYLEAAHYDYEKPLDVLFLCVKCHRNWDAKYPKGGTIKVKVNENC